MLAPALALAAVLAADPTGEARVDPGERPIVLNLVSFTTDRVVVRKKGAYVCGELLFRSANGDKLELRVLYRGPGVLAPGSIVTLKALLGGTRIECAPADGGVARVALGSATPDVLSGDAVCLRPVAGRRFEASFRARR